MNLFLQETGCKVLAILQISFCTIIIVLTIGFANSARDSEQHENVAKIATVIIVLLIGGMICAIYLFIGIKKRNKNYLIPWLVLSCLGCIGSISEILVWINLKQVFTLGINLYFAISVYKLYQLFVVEEINRLALEVSNAATMGNMSGQPNNIAYYYNTSTMTAVPFKEIPLDQPHPPQMMSHINENQKQYSPQNV